MFNPKDEIEEIKFIDEEDDDLELEDYIMHYGRPHEGYTPHSGRYEWGSGENAYQRAGGFLQKCLEMKKDGLSDVEIAAAFNMSTTELRAKK